MFLNTKKFLEIIHNTPLVSIDLIIKDNTDRILLGYRKNRPARGYWFVPGGRVRKNEALDKAFHRILKIETGIESNLGTKKLLGVYDHIYPDNFAGAEGINTHYVVIAYETILSKETRVLADEQHEQYSWWTIEDILKADNVHQNTKNYFLCL